MGKENKLTLDELERILKLVKDKRLEYEFTKDNLVMRPKRPSQKPKPEPELRLDSRPKPDPEEYLFERMLEDLTAGIFQKPELRPQMGTMKQEINQKKVLTVQLRRSFVVKMQPGPKLEMTPKMTPKLQPPGSIVG